MHLGYLSQTGAGSATLWVAKEAGILEKYGIDGTEDYLPPAQLTQAVVAGNLDLGQGSSANVASAVAQGADLVMIGCNVQGPIYTIVGSKSLSTAGLDGLRGKRISGGASASTGELTIKQLLGDKGMTAGKDYSVIPFPQDAGALAALQQGSIDAAIFSEPSTSVALSQGAAIIYDQKTSGVKNVGGPLLVTHAYLASHQDVVKRFLMADLEAMHLIKTDPARAATYAGHHMQVDPQVATNAMKAEGELMDGYLSIPLESLRSQMEVAASTNAKVGQLKPEQLVDTTLLDGILATDFVTKLYNGSPPPKP